MCRGFCRLFRLCTHCTLEWCAFYRSDAPYLFLDHDPTPFLFLAPRVMKKEKLAEVPWRNFERASFESSRCTITPTPITHHPSLHDRCACTVASLQNDPLENCTHGSVRNFVFHLNAHRLPHARAHTTEVLTSGGESPTLNVEVGPSFCLNCG